MMRPAYSPKELVTPENWQTLPYGDWLQQQVGASLNDWWPKIFGYHLLKLGNLSSELATGLCPVAHQINLAPESEQIQAKLEALPFKSASIDACLSTFCLEFHRDPHSLLREIDRVLISGGRLILVGFNPLSSLGMGYLWPANHKRLPWSGRLFTPARIQDWLGVLGYRVLAKECLCQHGLLWAPTRFASVQQSMKDVMPGLGSVYLIVAEKLDSPLTPVRQKWKIRRPLVVRPFPELAGRDSQSAARQRDPQDR
ncbi:class I SAM-dependent methyltransferase [Ferrimonas pelagia]